MKSFFILFVFLFSLLNIITKSARAQGTAAVTINSSGYIKGAVINSATKKAIDFMTIALKKDKIVIKTMVTKTNGTFSFDNVAPGKYMVTASAIGYNVKNVAAENTSEKTSAELGKILVAAQVNNLKEVSVIGDRPIIKQEVDRITYDIQADRKAKS